MWVDYLSTVAVLFALYLLAIRPLWLLDWHVPPDEKSPDLPGNAFDSTPLASRVQLVREEIKKQRASADAFAFKRELRLSETRARLTRMAFLQTPSASPSETTNPAHVTDLLLI
jgi:hypothetical protein